MTDYGIFLRKIQKQLKTRVYLKILATGTGSVHYMKDDSIVFVFGDTSEFADEYCKILNEDKNDRREEGEIKP